MNSYVNSISLDQGATDTLRRDGYLKLGGLFSPGAVEGFRTLLGEELVEYKEDRAKTDFARAGAAGHFARYSNNVDISGELMKSIFGSETFRALCAKLDGGEWLLTQALGFEIQPGQRGLAWHFGFRSFCFIDPEDQGYTLWIPLDPVDPTNQNGGLPVVSEAVYSGREETKLIKEYCLGQDDQKLLQAAFENMVPFSGLRNAVLEKKKVELAFQPGDALLFNRYVFHKSAEFLDGPQKRRRAFVMRLIPASARFVPELFQKATKLFNTMGLHTHEDPVADRLTDLKPGDRLGNTRVIAHLY